jgi:hypothetical protein
VSRDRTGDTRIFSPLLYQLSYRTAFPICTGPTKISFLYKIPKLSEENYKKLALIISQLREKLRVCPSQAKKSW